MSQPPIKPPANPTPGYQPMPTGRGGHMSPAGGSPTVGSDPQPQAIDRYRPPRNHTPLIVSILVMALVAAGVFFGARAISRPNPAASETPTPSPSRPIPTALPSGNAIPVQSRNGRAEAFWEITKSQWTPLGLVLNMKLTGTRGTLDYTFFALDNKTTDQFRALPAPTGEFMGRGTVSENQTIEGTVLFSKDRGDTMVVIADENLYQITALPVNG